MAIKRRKLSREEIEIAARLRDTIKSRDDLTEESVGDAVGVSQGQVSHWTGGRLPVPAKRASALASALGIDDPGKISVAYRELSLGKAVTVTRQWPATRNEGRLPYLEASQIPAWLNGDHVDVHDWMHCPAEDVGTRAFVTVVPGVAMAPQVEDGAFVFVDPDQRVMHGRLALVLIPHLAVRELQMEGDMQFLATTGRDWPGPKLTPMPEDAVIAGAVVGKWVPA